MPLACSPRPSISFPAPITQTSEISLTSCGHLGEFSSTNHTSVLLALNNPQRLALHTPTMYWSLLSLALAPGSWPVSLGPFEKKQQTLARDWWFPHETTISCFSFWLIYLLLSKRRNLGIIWFEKQMIHQLKKKKRKRRLCWWAGVAKISKLQIENCKNGVMAWCEHLLCSQKQLRVFKQNWASVLVFVHAKNN